MFNPCRLLLPIADRPAIDTDPDWAAAAHTRPIVSGSWRGVSCILRPHGPKWLHEVYVLS